MALLISKSLLHSERNRLLAPREANQIKQSGKEDSLFINLTRSPGDSRSRLGILLQLLLDASPTLLALLPWITQAGTRQHPTPWVESGRGAMDSCVTLLFSDASTLRFQDWNGIASSTSPPLPTPDSGVPSLTPASEESGTIHGFTRDRAEPAPAGFACPREGEMG